jgi:hypothetical protein
MLSFNKYGRGSEWAKWDLHVHTPVSIVQQYGGDKTEVWEKFIADLENLPTEFKVIGINDYLFIDGYKKVIEFKESGRLNNIDLILPVLEFRISKFAGNEKLKKINFHIIFCSTITPDVIEAQFINALSSKFHLAPGSNGTSWSGVITRVSVADLGRKIKETVPKDKLSEYGTDLEEGFNNLVVNEDEILEILKGSSYFKCSSGTPLYLTALGKTEWDDFPWTDGSIAIKKDIINKVDLIFIASENTEKFHKAKSKLTQQEVNDLLIDCSDAHSFSETSIKDRIGNCFTWIKSNPTFNGLKHVVYDPEERVCIHASNPSGDFPKPYFSKILIQETEIFGKGVVKFSDSELDLSSGLVAIIGGRGTGKSLLLDAIAKTFGKIPKFNEDRVTPINIQDKFSITYTKNNGESNSYKSTMKMRFYISTCIKMKFKKLLDPLKA